MHLHIGDQLVLRDVAGDPANIRSADPLAKQEAQISVAKRLGRHFLWTVEAGVIGREENGSRNLVGRESSAVCAMKYLRRWSLDVVLVERQAARVTAPRPG